MQDQSSRQLGNYRLKQLLGHGGFADVYLGEHIHLGTNAAIKILHTRLAGDEVAKFKNEGRTIAHLAHPHIIRVLDFNIEQQRPFLVMEYAPKGTLRQRHPKGIRLPPDTVLTYLKQVASALQYAHDQKLIHRDVKPENMLIAANGNILLSDFGIALIAQSTQTTQPGEPEEDVVGTMSYMAPEQLQGRTVPASDQYALAVVIYEWLSGVKPFNGSYLEVMSQKLSTQPPPLNPQSLMIPPAVAQVVMHALRKDPRQRFSSIQEFARAFELALHPPVPLPFGIPPRFVTAPRKVGRGLKKGLLVLAISLALCAILSCGLSFAGVNLFKDITNLSSGAATNPDIQMATTSSNSFMQDLENHNYDLAYRSLAPSLTSQVPHNQFVQNARHEDVCDGNIVGFSQLSASSQTTRQSYVYLVTRQKLSKSYHLNLTLQKNSQGTWQITDYNSDIAQPTCP